MTDTVSKENELWEAVRAQGKAIIGLEANQASIRDSLVSITNRLEHISSSIEVSGKTPWTAIGAVSTIVIFLVGGFSTILFYSYSSNLDHVITAAQVVREAHFSHVEDGHPRHVLERVDHLHDEIVEVKEDNNSFRDEARLAHEKSFDDLNERITRLEQDLKDGLYNGTVRRD